MPNVVPKAATITEVKPKPKTGSRKKATRRKSTRRKTRRKTATRKKASPPRAQRPYPARTLEEALAIPKAIREHNNGNPWSPDDVARAALDVVKNNNKFFYAAAASRDYGLTTGSRDTDKIELTELGRQLCFAGDEQTERQKKIDAFFSIDIFKRVYEYYGGSNLPKEEFLSNVLLEEFGLDTELHTEFARFFKANCKFLGIEKGIDEGVEVKPTDKVEHPGDIRVVGQPKGKFDRTAFVIMPFLEKGQEARPKGFFTEVLDKLVTPAANAAGFAVETAEQGGSDVIQSTIINQLLASELIVADLSDHNPNVLFELGIRIAKDLPVALIKAEGTRKIFDVDNMMRVFPYSPNLWPSTVEHDLPKLTDHIKASWNNRMTDRSYMQILTGVPRKTAIEPVVVT